MAGRFAAAEVDLSVLPHLNEHDLEVGPQHDCQQQQQQQLVAHMPIAHVAA